METSTQVILVDEHDQELGTMDKMEAHQKGELHRAISVFIFNTNGEMLLQQRNAEKYHSGLLWTNTCCSHPLPGEDAATAASRRLHEEMGITAPLQFLYSFKYLAAFDNGLTEHELDHIFWGITDSRPNINRSEVQTYKYITRLELKSDMLANPDKYTAWFRICVQDVLTKIDRLAQ